MTASDDRVAPDDLTGVRQFWSIRRDAEDAVGSVVDDEDEGEHEDAAAVLVLDGIQYRISVGREPGVHLRGAIAPVPNVLVLAVSRVAPERQDVHVSPRVVNMVRRRATFDDWTPHQPCGVDALVGVCELTGGVLFEVGVLLIAAPVGPLTFVTPMVGVAGTGSHWTLTARLSQGWRPTRIVFDEPDGWVVHAITCGSREVLLSPVPATVFSSSVSLFSLSFLVMAGDGDFRVDVTHDLPQRHSPRVAVVCRGSDDGRLVSAGEIFLRDYPGGRHDVWPHDEPAYRWATERGGW